VVLTEIIETCTVLVSGSPETCTVVSGAASTGFGDPLIGQMVVYKLLVSVVTLPMGQFVTAGAQPVMVYEMVVQTVLASYPGGITGAVVSCVGWAVLVMGQTVV
jgi:hypothetical protein